MPEQHLASVLAARPCGLLTDIDGTISPIAPTPEAAQVSPAAREYLRALARHLALVGVVSGRAAADAAALVGLPELVYVGNHGLEIWRGGSAQPMPEALPYVPLIARVLDEARAAINLPGVIVENKGVTGAVHYRLSTDPASAGPAIGALLRDLCARHGLKLTPGRMVWEIRPPLEADKGTAVRALAQQYGLRGLIFLGDDRTDADAFAVLRDLRRQGAALTLAIGVAADETPREVRELADVLVPGVAGAESVLAQAAALAAAQDATTRDQGPTR
ncbi:trehalose-phosphatase [Kallotenue papyrolyticum]|uniref:trehalose-phosphatase n=1 Tax=Kallotenue papyrolyticum TaxID=1325125 RepID=UPI0004785CF4|nr:trehalose-phosphatase [Kallotenue papyrolyticum]